MSERLDASSPDNVDTFFNMPRGPERVEALGKAQQLRYAAEAYNYLFSNQIGVWNHEFPKFTFYIWLVPNSRHPRIALGGRAYREEHRVE
jgi:hypothetical protein